MAKFMVFTVDHDEQQTFVDVSSACSRAESLATVLKHRDYCCHGVAYTADELRQLADDCETKPADFFEEVP